MPRFRPRNRATLRELMENTGDGSRASIRDIAEVAGVAPSLIGEVLSGEQDTVSAEVAAEWSARIGCDLLVLFVPVERATATRDRVPAGSVSV